MKRLIISCLLIFIVSCNGKNQKQSEPDPIPEGQPKMIKTLSTNKYANVHCGLQDKVGNLWFGTTGEGVCRYDGKLFVNFTEKDGLNSNDVWCIYKDKGGNLWFGTGNGICFYDGKTFTNMPIAITINSNLYNMPNSSTTKKNAVWSIMQDKSGKLWFGTSNGVYCYNGMSFTHFLDNDNVINKDSLNLKHVSSILEDKIGNIWFTTWFEGVCRYNGKSITGFKPYGKVWFASMLEDKNGNLWFGTRDQGAYRYDGINFINFSDKEIFNSCCVNSIAEDKAGNIWFGTEFDDITKRETRGGVWCYDGKSFKNFTLKDGLSNMSVFNITIDKLGKLWFGTRGMGLCSYDGKIFTNFMGKEPK